ncbi:ABC transporter permease [Nitrosomonas communis]|uniref:ABC transporter permease n=1 Tax=Nitrosomonas communis TaxID=44574 RepID=UPI0026EFE4B8|nr:ABC transporter permease [Nitrosomonas communis]MCO6428657.1 ABC transporter permease [Nitrosomonas communis]
MFVNVAWHSLLNRKYSVLLALISVAISTFVLLGVEHIRHEAKESFSNTVSGVDLIVGARTGPLNLLLYSVFRMGNATNNIAWESYRELAADAKVAWTIPISLGDSHRGYRVMGTTQDYFAHFRFGQNTPLTFAEGRPSAQLFDVVIGAEVARKLDYRLHDHIILAHGLGQASFSLHDDKPFQIVGILRATGTPVDQALYVSLQGMEAIHLNWKDGVKIPGRQMAAHALEADKLTPKSITAFMVGLKSKMATFHVQRQINHYQREPLLAILPGIALTELWQMMSVMENTLRLISILVLFSSLLGLSTMLLSSIRERQREIAVMRAIGASPLFIFLVIQTEALLISLSGIIIAICALAAGILFTQALLAENYGVFISHFSMNSQILGILGIIIASTLVLALIPSLSAYRMSLHQGLAARS